MAFTALSKIRKAPLAVVLMLSCAVPAHAGWFSSDDPKPVKQEVKAETKPAAPAEPGVSLEDSIRQAQMLRLAGQYPEAVKHLSQLMMVAADDGRVIGEYGKTLASMGRASDAVNFLTRAQQLQPGDWTIYSALGVAYDQVGDQKNAQLAYEQALKIKPEEPSVLNNYALSRMLAQDPESAKKLAARAEHAGGLSDDKIARNIAMIRNLAPETPAPAPVAANSAPAAKPESKVVMQRVPVDPLAGPVQGAAKAGPVQKAAAPVATAKPALSASVAATQAPSNSTSVKAAEVKAPTPVASAATGAPRPLQPVPVAQAPLPSPMASPVSVPVKAADKPAPVPVAAATTPAKPAPAKAAPVKVATPVSVPAKTAEADKNVASVSLNMTPVKAADAGKSASTPKVLPAKAADVKTAETAPKTKDAIPGLRMSANAY